MRYLCLAKAEIKHEEVSWSQGTRILTALSLASKVRKSTKVTEYSRTMLKNIVGNSRSEAYGRSEGAGYNGILGLPWVFVIFYTT